MASAQTFEDMAAFARRGSLEARPHIVEISVPPRVRLGESVTLRWRVDDAGSVRIAVAGALDEVRDVAPNGVWTLRPRRHGAMVIEVTALPASDDEPAVSQSLCVQVVAPPVELRLFSPTRLLARPGKRVDVAWSSQAAMSVSIMRSRTGETLALPASGVVGIEVGGVAETVHLIASGLDGTQVVRCIEVQPDTGSLPPLALQAMFKPLEEMSRWM